MALGGLNRALGTMLAIAIGLAGCGGDDTFDRDGAIADVVSTWDVDRLIAALWFYQNRS